MTYRVKNWDKHFETYESKRLRRLAFVVIPNKHDGKSYRRLMRHPNGPALYGAWILIVQVASRCPVRGVLADDDGPLSAQDLADKTDCPETVFFEALQVLSQPSIGWLTCDDCDEKSAGTPADPTGTPARSAGIPVLKGREGKGREQKGIGSSGACSEVASLSSLPTVDPQEVQGMDSQRQGLPAKTDDEPIVMSFPCVGRGAREWHLGELKLAEYRDSFPGVDVLAQCRAARQWCIDNGEKRKTASGMPKFLTRWLTKAQNEGGANGRGRANQAGLFGRGGPNPSRIRSDDPALHEFPSISVDEALAAGHAGRASRPDTGQRPAGVPGVDAR